MQKVFHLVKICCIIRITKTLDISDFYMSFVWIQHGINDITPPGYQKKVASAVYAKDWSARCL